MYTYKLLKKYNVFNYNDACMPFITPDLHQHPHHQPLTLITRSRSGSGGGGGHPAQPLSPHSGSFMDELAGAAGHGLLNGKVRRTQLYPSMSASGGGESNTKHKKGI